MEHRAWFRKEHKMRMAIEMMLLILGAVVAAYSVTHRVLPRGVLEWGIWLADAVIIVLRFAGV